MIYKKFLILLFFSSFYMSSALSMPTLSLPQIPASWEKALDFHISFNLNPIKIGSYIKNNPWKTLSILAPIVAYKLYYDEEVKKRMDIIRNLIRWNQDNLNGVKNAPPIAQTCYYLWFPFIKDPTVSKAVDKYIGGSEDSELMKKVLQFPTLADYLYYLLIPGWFK